MASKIPNVREITCDISKEDDFSCTIYGESTISSSIGGMDIREGTVRRIWMNPDQDKIKIEPAMDENNNNPVCELQGTLGEPAELTCYFTDDKDIDMELGRV